MKRINIIIPLRRLTIKNDSWKNTYITHLDNMWKQHVDSYHCNRYGSSNKETCPCAKGMFITKVTILDLEEYIIKNNINIDLKNDHLKLFLTRIPHSNRLPK